MTYLGRFDHFRCDRCGEEVSVPGNRKMSGWVWTKEGMGKNTGHRCPECSRGFPRDLSVPMGQNKR